MPDVGDIYRFGNYSTAVDSLGVAAAAFANLAGAATDPTAVTLVIRLPDETFLEYGWPSAGPDGVLTRESAGRFYRDAEIDQSGTWRYRLAGTGTVTAAAEGSLRIQRQRVVVTP